jgi:hypothetical protein
LWWFSGQPGKGISLISSGAVGHSPAANDARWRRWQRHDADNDLGADAHHRARSRLVQAEARRPELLAVAERAHLMVVVLAVLGIWEVIDGLTGLA